VKFFIYKKPTRASRRTLNIEANEKAANSEPFAASRSKVSS